MSCNYFLPFLVVAALLVPALVQLIRYRLKIKKLETYLKAALTEHGEEQ